MKNRKFLLKFVVSVSIVVLALTVLNYQTALANDNDRTSHIELHGVPAGAHTVVQWQGSNGDWNNVDGWRANATGDLIRWTVEEKDFNRGPFRWVAYDQSGSVIGVSPGFVLPQRDEIERVVLHRSGGDYHASVVHPGYYEPATPSYGYTQPAPPVHSYGHPMQYDPYPYREVRVIAYQQTYQPPCSVQPSYQYGHDAYSAYNYNPPHYQYGYSAPHYQHGPVQTHYGFVMDPHQMSAHHAYPHHR